MVLDVAKAAPLPEAKTNDVGFSQQVLARLDDFFAREMAAKRVSGAVVAISTIHYKGTASSIRQKIRRFSSRRRAVDGRTAWARRRRIATPTPAPQ